MIKYWAKNKIKNQANKIITEPIVTFFFRCWIVETNDLRTVLIGCARSAYGTEFESQQRRKEFPPTELTDFLRTVEIR